MLDIYVKSSQFKVVDSDLFPSGVALCEAFGAKIEVDNVTMASGGGATNNAVSFTRKGINAACIAEMGTDLASASILHELEAEKVDTSLIIREPSETTGVSVIMVAGEGGRSIISCRGAASMLGENDIPWDKLDTKWLHISSLGGNVELLEKLLEIAEKKKN